jgi:hypothetical protein
MAHQRNKAAGPAAISKYEHLFAAIEGFVGSNGTFESSAATETVLAEIGDCRGLDEAFEVPIAHKLFAMDAALRWALFLGAAPARAEKKGDAAPPPFSYEAAMRLIGRVYDLGMDDAVWVHFEDEEEEDEEEK